MSKGAKMNVRFVSIIILLSVFSCVKAFADEDMESFDGDFSDEDMFSDIPSVFSASKYEQKVTEAPARISIVTAEEIRYYGHRTLIDVLNTLPGFQTTYDYSYNHVGVRGFGVSEDYNTRVLVLVDGHRINEKIFDGVILDNGFMVDIDLIERVEVVRGPASSIYGNNAFFGVVNVITKRGRDLQGIELAVSTASQSSHKARMSYGKRLSGGAEMLLSATYYESEGDDRIYYSEYDDPATNNGIADNVDDSDSHSFYASLKYDEFTLTAAYQKQSKTLPSGSYNSVFNDPRTITTESHGYVDGTYQHLFNNGADLTVRAFYDDYYYDGAWASDYADTGNPDDYVVWEERADGLWAGAEVLLTQTLADSHRVTLGAEHNSSSRERQINFDPDGTYLDINPKSYSSSVFIQDDFHVTDNFIANLGVRYDDYSTTDSIINPRLAMIWNPIDDSVLKLIYGTAFRAPNSYEIYYHDNGESAKASVGLKPEKIRTVEFILEQRLPGNWDMMLSLYQNEVDNLISLSLDPADDLLVFINQDEVSAQGIEIEFNGRWESGWSNSINYTYQDSEDDQGNPLPNVTKNMYKFNVISSGFGNGYKAGIELRHEDGRPLRTKGKTKAHSISNLTISNDNIFKNVGISIGIYNMFDTDYSYPVGEENVQSELEQYERSFRLLLSYKQ